MVEGGSAHLLPFENIAEIAKVAIIEVTCTNLLMIGLSSTGGSLFFLLTSYVIHYIIYSDGKHKEVSSVPGRQEKGGNMDDMNLGEILKEVAEENQTRKILELLNESKDLEEAREKVKSLLEK